MYDRRQVEILTVLLFSASKFRENIAAEFVYPIIVDEGRDQMCFVFDGEYYDEIDFSPSKLEFSAFQSNALSVTDALYEIIETDFVMEEDIDQLLITTSYITAGTECQDDIRATYVNAIKGLSTYSSIPFENFFWTTEDTTRHFEGQWDRSNVLIVEDAARHTAWMNLFEVIKAADPKDDICRFADMTDYVLMPNGEVSTLPRPHYMSYLILRCNNRH
jgi:hypothetical protein